MGFRLWGLGFGVWGLGFGVWGLGFGVWGLGLGLQMQSMPHGRRKKTLKVSMQSLGFRLSRPEHNMPLEGNNTEIPA